MYKKKNLRTVSVHHLFFVDVWNMDENIIRQHPNWMVFAKTHKRKNKQGHLMILWLDDPPKGKFVVNFYCDWVGIYSEQRVTFHDKSTRNFSNCCHHPPNTWKLNGIKVRHWLTQPAWTTGGFICYFPPPPSSPYRRRRYVCCLC